MISPITLYRETSMKKLLASSLIFLSVSVCANDALRQQANMLFGTLPSAMPGSERDTPELIALGKKLYMDTRLSANNSQSCNTCHNVKNGSSGVDNQITSTGAYGKKGVRNSPTVMNAGFQTTQFWDGRAADLAAQAKGPVLNPIEMAMPNEAAVEKKLQAVPEYQKQFTNAFGQKDQITYNNIALAIASYERTFITKDRFDLFLKGDDKALNAQEQKGLQTFINTGCASCHSGPTLGGKLFMKVGLINPYKNTADLGRYDVTKNEADKFVFKVPMLRDIARTAPYFHDGKLSTLDEAVKKMAWLQLGKKLDEASTADIVAFLKSTTHIK